MTLSSSLATVCKSGSILYEKIAPSERIVKVRANGSDLFIGAIVTKYGETNSDVDLAATGEVVSGVIYGSAEPEIIDLTYDSDTCYSDNAWLRMYVPIPGDILYGISLASTAITINTWVDVSGGFLTTGTRTAHIGVAVQAAAGASNTSYVILYEWGPV